MDFHDGGLVDEFPPLEKRLVEFSQSGDGRGPIKRIPALAISKYYEKLSRRKHLVKNKIFAPKFKYIDFYLPKLDLVDGNPDILQDWKDYMEMLRDDLIWLLKLPHYKFWSTMVYSTDISDCVLPSFLLRAPRFFEPEFEEYQRHPKIAPLYNDIHNLIFRIYLRVSTFKENREDHITPNIWADLLYNNYLFDIPKLIDICALFDTKENHLLPKMIENVLKHQPKFVAGLDVIIPMNIKKSLDLEKELETRVKNSERIDEWSLDSFQEILTFITDGIVGYYKLMKIYPSICEYFHSASRFEMSLASSYERNVVLWTQVTQHLPSLASQVHELRINFIRLFRLVLFTPTLGSAANSTDPRIDDFFNRMTSYLEEKYLIHDYEMAYPFKCDMQTLLSRGIYVDETRIEYLTNAIASCFQANGENYSTEKLVTDPLYDPHFDRQLLGACSLDITGVELQSLITQVKDLLPDTPDPYIEVCLKHYGYSTEATINALLENTVPESLEAYKNPEYVKSQVVIKLNDEAMRDDARPSFSQSSLSVGMYDNQESSGGGFWKTRTSKRPEETVDKETIFKGSKILKDRILRNIQADAEAAALRAREGDNGRPFKNVVDPNSYLDESLLPNFKEEVEYNDEYDDTYDEVGVGMTEPDNVLYKPLNYKVNELRGSDQNDNGTDESDQEAPKRNDNFVEDPAIVRARFEEKRQQKFQQQNPRKNFHQGAQGDVVGRAKGHGQEKEVLQNRKMKDQAGSHNRKKRSDWKRKEF